MKITGTIYDSTGANPVQYASAMAVRMKDSLLLAHTRSDVNGKFTLTNFPIDTFSLIISYPGFDDKVYFMFGHADNFEINIPSIRLLKSAKELDEIVIYSNKNPIFYRGDTLVYVADSFKVHEGAVVEDLLKKLPGITVDKDGKIKSQGQEISKVLVDGDEFFGTDPTIATKNLGAEAVENVQIYEKEDENNIGGNDEKIKVLDLKLKEGYKKGYFGRVSGASDFWATPLNNYYGTRPFYEGELLLNYFNSNRKISVFGLGSNTPRTNFGRADLNKFGLNNESSGSKNFWEDNANNTSGIPQAIKAGVYYSEKFGKKKNNHLLFNYSYYNDQLDARSGSKSQYFLPDTTYFTNDSTRDYSLVETHSINLDFTTKIDSLTTLRFNPQLTFDKTKSESSNFNDFISSDNVTSLATKIQNTNNIKGHTFNSDLSLTRKFMKKRRELELRYYIDNEQATSKSNLYTRSEYFQLNTIDTIDQQKTNAKSNLSHFASAEYVEPISKMFDISAEYLFEYGLSNQNRSTYDLANGAYTSYRTDLSNNFDNTRMQNRGGLKLIFHKDHHNLKVGANVRNIQIENLNLVTDSSVNQNINSVLPSLHYEYKPSMSTRFDFRYQTNSDQPAITDLQPIPDNSNPNRIKIGNPDLKPNYSHNFSANFNKWSALSGRFFWSGTSVSLTDNDFGTETNFDQYGRTISKTVNVDGNLNANLWLGGGIPFLERKIEIRPSLISNFYRFKSIVGTETNVTDNLTLNPEVQLIFRWDSLEIETEADFYYNSPKSSLSSASSTPYSQQKYRLDIEWRLPLGFTISTEGNFNVNRQKGGGFYNREFFVWNVEVSKKFLKTQNLILHLIGNDILNQNVNAQRTVNGNNITDYRTTIVSRYFLLKLSYRFNNNKTSEEDAKGMF